MSILVLENASVGYGGRDLFKDVSLRIAEGDRIGLIGANGTGKSTFLKVFAGAKALDRGRRQVSRGVRIGYLTQDIELLSKESLRNFVVGSVPGRRDIEVELVEKETELNGISEDMSEEDMIALGMRVAELHEKIAFYDEHYSEHQALKILAGLGFTTEDLDRSLSEFSGGWKMRAFLGALLFQKPDLLLLDEPTNHLDMPSVAWFAAFLKEYGQAFVLISHDREFLNEQIDRVVSIEPEGVKSTKGNYEKYVKQRAEEETILENQAKNLAREREHMQKFVDRFRAQANKAAAVQSRVKALAKMDDVELFSRRRVMKLAFPAVPRSVTEIVKLNGLAKSYGDKKVFSNVDLVVGKGQRIGLIGPNGAGKTTLLRILAGEIEASQGDIRLGNRTECGYYAQHHAETLHSETTVYNTIYHHHPDAGPAKVRSVLGALLFSGDDVDKTIGVLSGGERSRVALARLLVKPANLLLMDEPTNHLDLDSSDALAEGLSEYQGTLIFVSHNKSLVRKVATHIWNIEDGRVEAYAGTLDEYLYSSQQRRDLGSAESSAPPPAMVDFTPEARVDAKARKRKDAEARKERAAVMGPLRSNVEKLEKRIAVIEAEQAERAEDLADPEIYDDAPRRNALLSEFQKGAEKLAELSDRWEHAQMELEEATARYESGH